MWVDSHMHLQFPHFDGDRVETVARARRAGVVAMVVVGTDSATSRAAIDCAERFGMYATVGVHPHDSKSCSADTLAELRDLLSHPRVVALGEIGLDYARDYSPHDVQRNVFAMQLELAAELGLPVVVHCRDATDDVAAAIDTVRDNLVGGVLHCFSGDSDIAARARDWGFCISAAGNITRPAAGSLREVLRSVPLDMLLVETDSPYLLPAAIRRKGDRRNEPSFVSAVGQCLADVKEIPVEELARATTASAARLFGLDIDRSVVAGQRESE